MSVLNSARSEVTKQFSTSMWWILAIVLVVYIGGTAAALGFVFAASSTGALPDSGQGGMPALPADMLPPVIYSLASSMGYVFPLIIGTLMVTGEFRHKTLTPTFLATPARGVALAGKVVVGVLLGALYAGVALAASVVPGATIFALFGIDTGLGSADVWALIGRIGIALVIWVLIGIGVGSLVRNQVAAIVIVLAFTQFVEPIARTAAAFVDGISSVTQFLPGAASDALVGASIFSSMTGTVDAGGLEWWAGGLVLLGYAVVFMLLGNWLTWRRDVT